MPKRLHLLKETKYSIELKVILKKKMSINHLLACIISFGIVFISMPSIWSISLNKGLTADVNNRSSHKNPIPNLGGVAIFFSIILTSLLFSKFYNIQQVISFLSIAIILFFLGLKDDLMILSSRTKFGTQLIAAILFVELFELYITNFNGFFNIYEVNELVGKASTIFLIILIVNAYNLIDGIDGLAGTTAILFLIPTLILYIKIGIESYIILIMSSLGSIFGFLYFNFSKSKKIFLGDTGSMVIGFLLAFFSVKILTNQTSEGIILNNNNQLFVFSLLFFPIYDTARVFFIRIRNKKSPFEADKNHTHHRFLGLGINHLKTTIIINLKILSLFGVGLLLSSYFEITLSILFLTIIGIILFELPHLFMIKKENFTTSKKILGIGLLVITLVSCTSYKDVYYAQTNQKNFENNLFDQKIEANDILSVRIMSTDIESARIYNQNQLEGNTQNALQPEILKIKGYLVNDLGEINLPIIGKIIVNDKSTEQLEEFLQNKLITEGHLVKPVVNVRILNSKVTILGEVRNPGTFTFYEKNLTLLQALGLAGDLTINGSRKDVRLIRQENGMKTIYTLDLTKSDWMENPIYFVKQNDVIVVNPNDAKVKSAGLIGNVGTFVSVTSLLITSILLIRSFN